MIFDCVGGVLLVEVDCGCGWKTLRRVLSRVSWRVSPIGCRLCRLYRVSWGIAGGVRSRIWVGGVVLGGGLAL